MSIDIEQLKAAIAAGTVRFGARQAIKTLAAGSAKLVVLANNPSDQLKADITQHAKLAGVTIEKFDGTAKNLGIVCGKPFKIATVTIVEKKV